MVVLLGLVGCWDQIGPRGPGAMTATLVSPNGDEGIVLLEFRGEGIERLRAASGPFFWEPGDDGARVIVMHEFGGELWVSFDLEARDRPPEVEILQVAAPDDELRDGLGEYRVDWTEGLR